MRNIFTCILFIILILLIFNYLREKNREGYGDDWCASHHWCYKTKAGPCHDDDYRGHRHVSTGVDIWVRNPSSCNSVALDYMDGKRTGGYAKYAANTSRKNAKCGGKKAAQQYRNTRTVKVGEWICGVCSDHWHTQRCHEGWDGVKHECNYGANTPCPCDTARGSSGKTPLVLENNKKLNHGTNVFTNKCDLGGGKNWYRPGSYTTLSNTSALFNTNGTKKNVGIDPDNQDYCRRCWNPADDSKTATNKIKYKYDIINPDGWEYSNNADYKNKCKMPNNTYDKNTTYTNVNLAKKLITYIDPSDLDNNCKNCADGWGGQDCGIKTKFNDNILDVINEPNIKLKITGIMINMLIWKYYRNTPNDKNLNEIGEAGSSFTLTNLHTIISSYLNTQIGNFKRNITTNLKNFLGVNHVRVALENNIFLSEK